MCKQIINDIDKLYDLTFKFKTQRHNNKYQIYQRWEYFYILHIKLNLPRASLVNKLNQLIFLFMNIITKILKVFPSEINGNLLCLYATI